MIKNDAPKILIVDDEVEIQDMLRRHFSFLGYYTETAGNGFEALELLSKTRFDVIISDILMPVMDGLDLLKKTRMQHPMSHTIMITAYITMENILACMRHGADTCIFKPLDDLSELEEAVKNAVNSIEHWKLKLKQLLEIKSD